LIVLNTKTARKFLTASLIFFCFVTVPIVVYIDNHCYEAVDNVFINNCIIWLISIPAITIFILIITAISYDIIYKKRKRLIEINNELGVKPQKIIKKTKKIDEEKEKVIAQKRSIVDVAANSQQVYLVGSQGAGKTNTLGWLVDKALLIEENVYMIDPHGFPGKWPESVIVVGTGKDYDSIHLQLNQFVNEIELRFRQLSNGERREGDFSLIRIFIDEATLLPREIGEDYITFLKVLCTESRKVGFRFTMCTHSKRTDSTGFKGMNDLFEQIHAKIYLKKQDNTRFAIVEYGDSEDKEVCKLPPLHERLESLK